MESDDQPPVYYTDSTGYTWTAVELPGLRSRVDIYYHRPAERRLGVGHDVGAP